jgi:hypothetical protein
MKYHPDKNPEGRDMFEQVNKAYEFISSKEARYVCTWLQSVPSLTQSRLVSVALWMDPTQKTLCSSCERKASCSSASLTSYSRTNTQVTLC